MTTPGPADARALNEPLSLGRLLQILLRFWVLILLVTVLAAAAAFGATQLMAKTYTATATQLVKALPGTGVTANYEAAQFAVARAKSYPSFVYSAEVLEGVRSDLGDQESVEDLRLDLSATNPVDTPLVQLSATGRTAIEAQTKADSAARHLSRFVSEIETIDGKSPIVMETAVQAGLPRSQSAPQVLLIVAVGGVSGLALALLLALLLDYRARRRAAAAATGVEAAEKRSDAESHLSVAARPDLDRSGAALADPVTSAAPGRSRTAVAANGVSRRGQRTRVR